MPVCQPNRNLCVRIFRDYTDIGFNATKKINFYGFKAYLEVTLMDMLLIMLLQKLLQRMLLKFQNL